MYTYKLLVLILIGQYIYIEFSKNYYFIILSICVKFWTGPNWKWQNLLVYKIINLSSINL